MKLSDIQPALDEIQRNPRILDLRAITYIATYPSLRAFGKSSLPIDGDRFSQLVVMAYGWMPRIVRVDQGCVGDAKSAVQIAAQATVHTGLTKSAMLNLARCLRSVVGASKVLHFVNDEIFPIWDSGVEAFRLGGVLPYNHMNNVDNYFAYCNEVHAIRAEEGFRDFLGGINAAMDARLAALFIDPYPICEVRAIEVAAFELAE